MAETIRQLLDFARRRPPKKTPIDAEKLVRQVIDLLRPLARKNRVSLSLEVVEAPPLIQADQGQLQQALTNLVVNAVQAMPQGGPIRLAVSRTVAAPPRGKAEKKSCIRIAVSDLGGGIDEEEIPHLFEPFFTTKDLGKGSGLGLSIAYGIVREHEGWIDVESQLGQGSVFSIFLPEEES